ncbi:MAG: hypothetical protein WDW36_005686 [Sanguina aurantia]
MDCDGLPEPEYAALAEDFVRVKGSRLYVGGGDAQAQSVPFYFVGSNCYYLLTYAADEAQRPLVLEVLDAAVQLHLTVLRAWAFNDGAEQWQALQTGPGEYNERVWQGLDWLLAQCAARQLRLLLTLVNYWPDYGGMGVYVRWSRGMPETVPGLESSFYEDEQCQTMFQAHILQLVGRVNRLTGVRYKDDATIMGWELANEPRCEGDRTGRTLNAWISKTAAYLRALDPFHLITVGSEGFFGDSTPDLKADNPYDTSAHGVDFMAQFEDPNIDFASIHLYPDHWCHSETSSDAMEFSRKWITSHAQLCATRLNKPLVLSEFGKRAPATYPGNGTVSPAGRVEYYQQVLETCLQNALHGGPLAGSCFWMLSSPSYPDYDGFALYYNQPLPGSSQSPQPPGSGRLDPSLSNTIPELGWEYNEGSSRGRGLYDAPYPPGYRPTPAAPPRGNSVAPAEALVRSPSGVLLEEPPLVYGGPELRQSQQFTAVVPQAVSTLLSAGRSHYDSSGPEVSRRPDGLPPAKASWLPSGNGGGAGLSFGTLITPDSSAHGGSSSLYRVRGDSILGSMFSAHAAGGSAPEPTSVINIRPVSPAAAASATDSPGSSSLADAPVSSPKQQQQQASVVAARQLLCRTEPSEPPAFGANDGRARAHLSPTGSLPRQSLPYREFDVTKSTRGLDPTLRVISIYARKMTNLSAESTEPTAANAAAAAPNSPGGASDKSGGSMQFMSRFAALKRTFTRPSLDNDWEGKRREKMGMGASLAGHPPGQTGEGGPKASSSQGGCMIM